LKDEPTPQAPVARVPDTGRPPLLVAAGLMLLGTGILVIAVRYQNR